MSVLVYRKYPVRKTLSLCGVHHDAVETARQELGISFTTAIERIIEGDSEIVTIVKQDEDLRNYIRNKRYIERAIKEIGD